ncbi:MAG: hypothetical protein ACK41T_10420 [Pseudobdellovibrio sp.]
MDLFSQDLMYEFLAKDLTQTEALKQYADHVVKEIKSTYGWDTDVQINIEPVAKDKHLLSVSMSVFGLNEPVIVKKDGKQVLSVLRKVRKAVTRQIHRLSGKRVSHHSRSPKIEVTGILVPFNRVVDGRTHKFRVDSDSNEYTLSLTKTLEGIAKKIVWEEVIVKGSLDLQSNVLEVEKISLSQSNDPIKTAPPVDDPYFDAKYYQEAIARSGKVETTVDYLAS